MKKALLRASSPLVGALTKPFIVFFSGPIAPFQITNINVLSCFGKLTSLLELTLDLSHCEGLSDLGPLSSMGDCINLQKLHLDCRGLKKAGTSSRTSIWEAVYGIIRTLRVFRIQGTPRTLRTPRAIQAATRSQYRYFIKDINMGAI